MTNEKALVVNGVFLAVALYSTISVLKDLGVSAITMMDTAFDSLYEILNPQSDESEDEDEDESEDEDEVKVKVKVEAEADAEVELSVILTKKKNRT